MSKANLMSRMRDADHPYLVFQSPDGSWTWKVLKSWQVNNAKPYARWLCSVSSLMTYGIDDMGDTYVSEVVENGVLVDWDSPEVLGSIGVAVRFV